ncbi:MAG: antitoxin VapB family protein [Candidatus Hodarchaeales archaeon]|jgi:predicted CopG family antitoxin
MAKNISLSETAYKKLSQEKRSNESFSDVILRLLGKKKSLSEVIGKKLIDPDLTLDDIRKASTKTLERISNENP